MKQMIRHFPVLAKSGHLCEKGKQPEWALELFEAMQRQGVVPDVIAYSALISACEKGKQPGQTL